MKTTRIAAGVATLAACSLALTACGGSATSGATGEDRDSITWMTMLHTPTTPDPGSPVELALEEHTGMDIEFQWVPDASKDEKINAALASDSLADIVSLTNITNTSVRQALTSGQFWDVEEYLDEFDNLSQIDPQTLDAARIDGELYGVPFQKPKARYGVLVRQDWLDNLGLEVPHTIEELGEVARAFAEDDPDGNGEDDTTGFIDREESFLVGFRSLAGYFGAGQKFTVTDDGTVVPAFTTDAFQDAMEWYRELYEDGGVNGEFVTMAKQNQQDAIARGTGGIVVTGLFEAKNYMNIALSADPDTPMAWALVNDVTYEDVPRRILTDTNGGMGGWLALPKSRVADEEDVRAVLGFIDKLIEPEAFTLMTYGIEGTHYSIDDADVVTIEDQGLWEREVQPYSSSRPSEIVMTFNDTTPYVNEGNEKMAENDEFVVTDPTLPLTSETYNQSWSSIEQQANDAYNQYIVGQIDMAEYEAVIDSLGAQGLDQITEEFTAAYEQANG
ncbi:extracellular solute-binding protein [Microbacterium excoecariae]|uniref:extracellular solute-binding protein n=1 Tax=Microbacterium excoecariae TaxID=2715210 RepID=UPI0014081EE9|nr:extracellular solute-binding protein [Microbacterium excoecariae]NHI17395.1 extracellular solute-binding protein [Microbacterium excoecariae]